MRFTVIGTGEIGDVFRGVQEGAGFVNKIKVMHKDYDLLNGFVEENINYIVPGTVIMTKPLKMKLPIPCTIRVEDVVIKDKRTYLIVSIDELSNDYVNINLSDDAAIAKCAAITYHGNNPMIIQMFQAVDIWSKNQHNIDEDENKNPVHQFYVSLDYFRYTQTEDFKRVMKRLNTNVVETKF